MTSARLLELEIIGNYLHIKVPSHFFFLAEILFLTFLYQCRAPVYWWQYRCLYDL